MPLTPALRRLAVPVLLLTSLAGCATSGAGETQAAVPGPAASKSSASKSSAPATELRLG